MRVPHLVSSRTIVKLCPVRGPIKDPAKLGPAIKEAIAVVKTGQPALLNVWTQPR